LPSEKVTNSPLFFFSWYFLPHHQKDRFRNRPVESTSAAGSASTSAACQQGVCVTSAWTQTVLIAENQ